MGLTLTQATLDAILANIIATGRTFDPAATFVAPFTGITDRGVNTLLADVTLATGDMATAQSVNFWTAVYHETDGRSVCDSDLLHFSPANSGEAQTILGLALADAATPTVLKGFLMLDAPVSLPDQHRRLNCVIRLTVDPLARWDASVVFDGG